MSNKQERKFRMGWDFSWTISKDVSPFIADALDTYIHTRLVMMVKSAAGHYFKPEKVMAYDPESRKGSIRLKIDADSVDGIQRLAAFDAYIKNFASTVDQKSVTFTWSESIKGLLQPRIVQDGDKLYVTGDSVANVIKAPRKDIVARYPLPEDDNRITTVSCFIVMGEINKVNYLTGRVKKQFSQKGCDSFTRVRDWGNQHQNPVQSNQATIFAMDTKDRIFPLVEPRSWSNVDINAINRFLEERNFPVMREVEFNTVGGI